MATQQVNERLAAITAAGTSVWLDQIKRSLITGGELKRLVEEDSLRGVTSNPSIFNAAILGSDDYDELLEKLAAEGKDNREIYQEIAIRDIQDGCDILRPVYDDADGADGFVSFEVDPDLAFDTDKTMEQAREYWQRVDRPNLMIKIPATTEGVPAIEQMIYEGLNINVTLLFGVEEYATVAEAFIKGLERRVADGETDLSMSSVASFFVSRVDTEVDKRLEGASHEDLKGKAGLANARAAYMRFKEIFTGERWEKLEAAGARVQRPLWASTGVKDPAYPDTLYVDGLIAPHTVNTMPMATLLAAADHGEVSGPTADSDPEEELQALDAAGIDLKEVTDKLLKDGVDKFVDPMEALLKGIDEKRQAVTTSRPSAVHAILPDERRAEGRRPREGRAGGRRRPAHLEQGRDAVGARGHPGGRRPPRLADGDRRDGRAAVGPRVLRRRGPRRGHDRRRAAGHGRLVAGPRGHPPVLRERWPTHPRVAHPAQVAALAERPVADPRRSMAGSMRLRPGSRTSSRRTRWLHSTYRSSRSSSASRCWPRTPAPPPPSTNRRRRSPAAGNGRRARVAPRRRSRPRRPACPHRDAVRRSARSRARRELEILAARLDARSDEHAARHVGRPARRAD